MCCSLISRLLVREPKDRASLDEIVSHEWLTSGPEPPSPPPLLPMLMQEHLTEDDIAQIVHRMVKGNIATKEEIFRWEREMIGVRLVDGWTQLFRNSLYDLDLTHRHTHTCKHTQTHTWPALSSIYQKVNDVKYWVNCGWWRLCALIIRIRI